MRHGTAYCYNMGCRNEECKRAYSEATKKFRQARVQHPERMTQNAQGKNYHGTEYGYVGYGCKCDDCRAAHAKYARDNRLRKAKQRQQQKEMI